MSSHCPTHLPLILSNMLSWGNVNIAIQITSSSNVLRLSGKDCIVDMAIQEN